MGYNTFNRLVLAFLWLVATGMIFYIIDISRTDYPGVINTVKNQTIQCKNMNLYDDFIVCDGMNYPYANIETFKREKD